MSRKISIDDDDEIAFYGSGLTTSGAVLRKVAEDMFGTTVDAYIANARKGMAGPDPDARIFSEGVEVVMYRDGSYTVSDRATGLPIAGVHGLHIEPWDTMQTSRGDVVSIGRRVELDIASNNMRCYLSMEVVKDDSA